MNVHIIAASDRNNYGDLLFPIILKKYLEKNDYDMKFYNYAIIESDLSSFGALPTHPFTQIYKNVKNGENNKIVIAGGEVIGGGWLNIQRFVSTFWNKVYHNKYLRFIINKFELLERYFYYKDGHSRPFILDGSRFNRNDIYYNSIGAQGAKKLIQNNTSYKNYFNSIKHLSIRDKNTNAIFNQLNINNYLVPDSALIMSDLMTNDLQSNISTKCAEIVNDNYIFLQIGNNKGPEDVNKFITDVIKIADNNKLKILLCPIGLALDHGDDIILKKIHSEFPNLQYYEPKNLYETMYLLKRSKMYVGTSLHGVITAQSFNVPFFVFPEKIGKLKIYIDTWFKNASQLYGLYSETEKIEYRFRNFDNIAEKNITEKHKELIYKNLLTIFPKND